MESILTSIKKLLGIMEDYEQFDTDVIIHINTTLMILNQLGVGVDRFAITDKKAVWTDFMPDETMVESVKSYVYLKVRLIFDPPQSSAVLGAIERTINELEWRINVWVENKSREEIQNG